MLITSVASRICITLLSYLGKKIAKNIIMKSYLGKKIVKNIIIKSF